MWNTESMVNFMKISKDNWYLWNGNFWGKSFYYSIKQVDEKIFSVNIIYQWKFIGKFTIENNSNIDFLKNSDRILNKLEIDEKTCFEKHFFILPKKIMIEDLWRSIYVENVTYFEKKDNHLSKIWNFNWKHRLLTQDIIFFVSEDEEKEYCFINWNIEEINSLKYKEINNDLFISDKNMKDWFFFFKPQDKSIKLFQWGVFHSTPFQMLFNFFNKQLTKKWIEKFSILLWNKKFDEKYITTTDSNISLLEIQLLILTNWEINNKLTKEMINIYLATGGLVKRTVEDEFSIYLIVDKNWTIFSFEKNYIQQRTKIQHLMLDYYFFDDSNGDKHIIKFSKEKKNFEVIDTLYFCNNKTGNIWIVCNDNWLVYVNDKRMLKFLSKWFNNWATLTLEEFKTRVDFSKINLSESWKEFTVEFLNDILYYTMEKWRIKKYLIKNIKDNIKNDFQWLYLVFRTPFPYFDGNKTTNKHISLFKYWIWWEKIDNKRILESKLLQLKVWYTIPWKTHRWRYRIMNGLKGLNFLQEFEWMSEADIGTKFFQVATTFMKNTTNIFNKWIFELAENHENSYNQYNQQNYLTVKLRIIEKLKQKNWFCLSNWKLAFLIKQ